MVQLTPAALPRRRGVRRAARRRGGRRRRQRAVRPPRERRRTSSSSSRRSCARSACSRSPTGARRSCRSARRCSRCGTAGRCSPSAAVNARGGRVHVAAPALRAGADAGGDRRVRRLAVLRPRPRRRDAQRALQPRAAARRARLDRGGDRVPRDAATRARAATAARGPASWASASTWCGRPSTATSPTRTASTARAGCGPTSAASTSTGSSPCWPAAVYFATGEEAVLLAAFVQQVILLQQLMPLLRFDGYYVLSDLTGVPDILSRIKPIFRSLLRPRRPEPARGGAQAVGARGGDDLPDRAGARARAARDPRW